MRTQGREGRWKGSHREKWGPSLAHRGPGSCRMWPEHGAAGVGGTGWGWRSCRASSQPAPGSSAKELTLSPEGSREPANVLERPRFGVDSLPGLQSGKKDLIKASWRQGFRQDDLLGSFQAGSSRSLRGRQGDLEGYGTWTRKKDKSLPVNFPSMATVRKYGKRS